MTAAVDPVKGKRGGARPGAGRKSKAIEEQTASADIVYAKARAQKMAYDAKLAELSYQVESGKYIPRDNVRQASATAMATIAQTMRSIPDNIERRLGVSPEVAESIGLLIDESLADLAGELERMTDGRA